MESLSSASKIMSNLDSIMTFSSGNHDSVKPVRTLASLVICERSTKTSEQKEGAGLSKIIPASSVKET